MVKEELQAILSAHAQWLQDPTTGKRADLSGATLIGANLDSADLSGATLTGARLRGANLRGADLIGANLRGADLTRADLTGANLDSATLTCADLTGADLDLEEIERRRICPDGAFTAWKKLADGVVCQLTIPADAARVGGLTERKCRASHALVVSGAGRSSHDASFTYAPGEVVRANAWNPDPRVVCSGGIHFFITRIEAEEYEF